eukprot:s162_g19.t1
MQTGTIKSYNPHKGWGFIECNGQDTFVNKKDLKGYCPSKGDQVQFEVTQSEKGAQATNVTVLGSPEELSYFGQIKSFNPNKGYGFITCEAFPGKDIFVLKSELPAGHTTGRAAATGKTLLEARRSTTDAFELAARLKAGTKYCASMQAATTG